MSVFPVMSMGFANPINANRSVQYPLVSRQDLIIAFHQYRAWGRVPPYAV